MADLRTQYVGLELDCPILVASAGITETVERMRQCQDHGAGGVVMKSWFQEEVSRHSPTPRFAVLRHDLGPEKTFTLYSYEQASEWDLGRYAQEVADAKAALAIRIIPSINCLDDEGWARAAQEMEAAGADALELNTSCPHGSITFRGGAVEESIYHTVEVVRQAVDLPLIAKLSPMLTSPISVAKRVEELGAHAVTIFNRMTGLEIDVQEEQPILHGGYAGHGGPWAIQYPLRWISAIRPAVDIDIAGSGGVASADDVVKYLLVGATVVQTCTAVVMNGYEVLAEFRRGLERWMDERGYATLDDFRGKVHDQILGTHEVDRRKRYRAAKRFEMLAPCKAACPAGVAAQSYVRLVAEGRYEEAVRIVRASNPFQSICGRACYAPCEDACTRGPLGGPIAIRAIKRFVDDWGRRHMPLLDQEVATAPPTGQRVAVVGSGPAGLTAAHDLALGGHAVTVFEALDAPGGMMAVGIPAYRLPKALVEEEVEAIRRLGVDIRTGAALGRDVGLESLRKEGYDAILLATGAHKTSSLGVPGAEAEGVADALEFLRRVNAGERPAVPRQVAVVGGGNSALDAARCALRLGADQVYVVYRRTRAEMPAHEREIADAEAEGVRILYLALPVEVVVREGRAAGLRCNAGYLEVTPREGRRPSTGVVGADFTLPAQMVLCAVGQRPDGELFRAQGLAVNSDGSIAANVETCVTSARGVFAAGDAAGRPGSIVEAIADGRRAAAAIDRFLAGESLEPPPPPIEPRAVEPQAALTRHVETPDEPRVEVPEQPAADRVGGFQEVELPLAEADARREAARCLACGCGVGCGLCEKVCIYSAIERQGDRFVVDGEKCDGCGLCTVRCAHGAIEMVEREE
ncbi:MAG: FAD-dependent oxidoreductase [Candidatus Brocadiia bacterium]